MEEEIISNNIDMYTVETRSSDKVYSDEQLFKSIFESLFALDNLSTEICAEEIYEGAIA